MEQFRTASPESAGVKSERVHAFLQRLEAADLATHDVLLARGHDLFLEKYYPPFTPEMTHRMYSVTKSFVSLAVGFALQDGLLSLDDPMEKFFAAELGPDADPERRAQTVRNMLMMSTAKSDRNWFSARHPDRVAFYFANPNPPRPAGTIFEYDSTGSFVLGALVERLTGKKLLDYLREKAFDKMGFSDAAHILTCPGGHSWSDSALLCTPMDLLKTARFVLNGGSWDGEQLLDADYVRDATSPLIANDILNSAEWEAQGYGYLIWIGPDGSWFFNGMGCQFAVGVPDLDLIMVYNGDNQGRTFAKDVIFHAFEEEIVLPLRKTGGASLPEDAAAAAALHDYADSLILAVDKGAANTPMAEKVDGVTYTLNENPMGITRFTLTFAPDGTGCFAYTNAQGEKQLPFGLGKNVFGTFPQTGYSEEVGSVSCPGHRYGCAVSGAWLSAYQFHLRVQIIDDYFGTLEVLLGFTADGRSVTLRMNKTAEDFLEEYNGTAVGRSIVSKPYGIAE